MNNSEQINELALALSKAQSEIEPAPFDKINPHFRSSYASLTSIMNSVRKILSKHGLAVIQSIESDKDKMVVVTKLIHASGQWISDNGIPLILDKNNMQSLGSAITYAKRYGISSLLSIVSDADDDGESAMGRGESPKADNLNKRIVESGQTEEKQPESSLHCEVCGAQLVLSKAKTTWYCPNFKDTAKGEHTKCFA